MKPIRKSPLLSAAHSQLKETAVKLERSKESLRESEEKFSVAFSASPDLMTITRVSDGQILEINKGFSRLLGYSRKESIGKTTTELSLWNNVADRKKFVDALKEHGQVLDFETVLRRKNGTTLFAIVSARTFELRGEAYILSTVHDITDRKKIEMELVKKNRALYLLSSINQALVHAADEASLLREVCRIAKEIGGYRMLWIGLKEDNDTKTVRPAASTGFEPGYLESLHITWKNANHGRDIVGKAIRLGKMQIVRHLSAKKLTAPWHKVALERHYQSAIALPLQNGKRILGAITFYDDRADAFTADEIAILNELASDLAFGIVSLRTSLERAMLEQELLQASTDRYKALFISSRDAVMTLEPPKWNFTSGNPATVKMFRMKSEGDFLRFGPWALSPKRQPDGRSSSEKAKKMIEKAMTTGSNFFEWTHKRSDGELFPAEVLLSKVEQNGKTFLHAVVRDITERKKLEKQLKAFAEEKFKVVFDHAIDGMALAEEKNKKFFLVNNAFAKMLGYDPNELMHKSIADVHPKKDLAYVLGQFEKQRKGEFVLAENIPMQRKDGSIFYVDINSSPVTIEGKKFLLGIFRDITERKKTEEAIRASEAGLKMAERVADLGSWHWDAVADKITWSDQYHRIVGFPIGQSPPNYETHLAFYTKESAERLAKAVQAAIKFGTPYEIELNLIHPPGTNKWLLARGQAIWSAQKKVVAMQGTIIDITKRKRLEENLRQKSDEQIKAAALHEALLASLGDAVFAVDAQGRLTYMNSNAETLFGCTFLSVTGRRFYSIWDLEEKGGRRLSPEEYPSFVSLKTRKRVSTSQFILVRKDGKKIPVTITASPVDIADSMAGIITVIKDITYEAGIDRAKDEFISLASHQLRTPLSIIKWYTESLLEGNQRLADTKQRMYIEAVANNNERLIDIVNSLLHISRIEQGKLTVVPQQVDVQELASQALKNAQLHMSKKHLTFHGDFARAHSLWIDPKILDLVLQNLIMNAVMYTPMNGKFGVSTYKQADKFILEVWDTGIGIPQDARAHVFEKFYRAQNAKNMEPNGTGLGLHIVKTFLSVLHGTIRFESKEGEGTKFIVEIPFADGKQPLSQKPPLPVDRKKARR